MPKRPYPTWRRRHEALLEYLLAFPGATQKQAAAETGYSASQVSRIVNAEDFRVLYDAARDHALAAAAGAFLAGKRPDRQTPGF